MTREEIYSQCVQKIDKTRCLLMELSTGVGKTKMSIDLVNHLVDNKFTEGSKCSMLLLVAKRVHKQTWKDEFEKWGGIKIDRMVIECYESLHKHTEESFDFIVLDECHHLSETRMEQLKTLDFHYMLGLSATIPRNVKQFFKWNYKSLTVRCDIVEAIEDEVLPEPEILLFPLKLDNTQNTEVYEVNPKSLGEIAYDEYRFLWKYKKNRQHAFLSCTQKQRSNEFNAECLKLKNRFNVTRNEGVKNLWLQQCGRRLEFYSNCKIPVVKQILEHLKNYRTITFCKTIEQCEQLGKNCIHSKNGKLADKYYNDFNARKIKHITAVNILNENANLVDCRYGIFCNLSSSDIIMPQRQGRLLRHRKPVMIVPYYEGTREQEIVEKAFENYNKDIIRVIHSVEEI